MKILTIIGARPQFIKAGTLSRVIGQYQAQGKDIQEVLVHTGQHYDANMSDIFFEEMRIPKPDYHLGIGGGSHGAMTGQMLEKIEEVLLQEKPDWVLVYGDTNSTLAGALAAAKIHIPVAHVEAGLRSFNMAMPEEVNRILTDRISRLLFCPTQQAINNLENEGLKAWNNSAQVIKSGDVMQDGALFYSQLAEAPEKFSLENFVLCTVHRAENTDDPQRLNAIFEALRAISHNRAVVLPIHPRTRKKLQEAGIDTSGIHLIDPVGYLNMVWLLQHCSLVMTDSGGLQKEAYFFGKYCITLRDETEWVELVESGANTLVGASASAIEMAYHTFEQSQNIQIDPDLYGGGKAAQNILDALLEHH